MLFEVYNHWFGWEEEKWCLVVVTNSSFPLEVYIYSKDDDDHHVFKNWEAT